MELTKTNLGKQMKKQIKNEVLSMTHAVFDGMKEKVKGTQRLKKADRIKIGSILYKMFYTVRNLAMSCERCGSMEMRPFQYGAVEIWKNKDGAITVSCYDFNFAIGKGVREIDYTLNTTEDHRGYSVVASYNKLYASAYNHHIIHKAVRRLLLRRSRELVRLLKPIKTRRCYLWEELTGIYGEQQIK